MNAKENKGQLTDRARYFTITGAYENGVYDDEGLAPGDRCLVKPDADYKSGDLVIFKCTCYASRETHYHARYFHKMPNGKKYSFRLHNWPRGGGGTRHTAEEESKIIGRVLKVRKGKKKAEQRKAHVEVESYEVVFAWPLYGLHSGDVVVVEENGQAKPGQLILVKPDDGSYEDSFFTRCCLVTSDTVRACGKDGEPYDKPRSTLIGAVVNINHDDCDHTKIEALRKQIAKLQSDSDAWSNVTRVHELEREIFNLEHPAEKEEESEDEWPEVLEDEED